MFQKKIITKTWVQVLIIFLATIALNSETLNGAFVYDDLWQILQNSRITNAQNWWEVFSWRIDPGNLYRPLSSLSFLLNYWLSGFSAFLFRLVNLALHAACCGALYIFLSKWFSLRFALVAVLLFAIHPIHAEVIAVSYNRTETLSIFFGLLACIVVQQAESKSKSLLLVAPLLAALLSKESGVVFTLLAPLTAWFDPRKPSRDRIVTILSLSLLTFVFYAVIRIAILGEFLGGGHAPSWFDNPLANLPFLNRSLQGLTFIADYFLLSVYPLSLSADYSYAKILPLENIFELKIIAKLSLVLLHVFLFIFALYKREKFGWILASFLLPLGISANVLILNNVAFAERFAYLPSMAGCAVLAGLLQINYKKMEKPLMLMVALIVLMFFLIQRERLATFQDNVSLLSFEIVQSPESVVIQVAYAWELFRRSKMDESLKYCDQALKISDNFINARLLRQRIYRQQRKFDLARADLEKVLENEPNNSSALDGLGWISLETGDILSAEANFQKALRAPSPSEAPAIGLYACAVLSEDLKKASEIEAKLSLKAKSDPRFLKYLEIKESKKSGHE